MSRNIKKSISEKSKKSESRKIAKRIDPRKFDLQ